MALTASVATPPPVRIAACQGCGACILTCPERALRPAEEGPRVLAALCTACGECLEVCPVDAISLTGAAPARRLARFESHGQREPS